MFSHQAQVEIANIANQLQVESQISPAKKRLDEFLTGGFVVESGKKLQNIQIPAGGCYNIPNKSIGAFFKLLNDARREGCRLMFQEMQDKTSSGIMLDVDRYQTSPNREITPQHLKKFVRAVIDELFLIVDHTRSFDVESVRRGNAMPDDESVIFDAKMNELSFHAFVIQKEYPVACEGDADAGLFRDGFHLLIPEIMMSSSAKKFLINRIINKKIMERVFRGLDTPPNKKASDMMDANSSSVPIYLFGSAKVSATQAYRLTHAYEVSLDPDCPNSTATNDLDIADLEIKHNLCYELSIYFSLGSIVLEGRNHRATWLKKRHYNCRSDIEAEVEREFRLTGGDDRNVYNEELFRDDVSLLSMTNPHARYLQRLLDILDPEYYCSYEKWLRCIWALHHTSPSFLPLAHYLSKLSPEQYSPERIDQIWEECGTRAPERPVTEGYIINAARESSPAKFKAINENSYAERMHRCIVNNAGTLNDANISDILRLMLCDKFQYAQIDTRTHAWYEFVLPADNHKPGQIFKWRHVGDNPHTIRRYMRECLPVVFANIKRQLENTRDAAQDEKLVKYWNGVIKALEKTRIQIGNNGRETSIIKSAQTNFESQTFYNELDSYTDIIGVGNGVLVLFDEPRLVKAYHEYKISKYTPTPYIDYDPNNPYVQKIHKFFDTICVEGKDVSEKLIFYLSTAVDKREVLTLILLLVGGGANGKTTMNENLSAMLGEDYSCKAPISLLTDDNESADRANSAMMSIKNKTFVMYSEPNGVKKLNTGRIKEMYGGEKQSGRQVFGEQENFINSGTAVVSSNFDFIANSSDYGFWRRIMYYRIKVQFDKVVDPSNPNSRQRDESYNSSWKKDPENLKAWLSLLVHYRRILEQKYGGDVSNVPSKTIDRETEGFRIRQDKISEFINERVCVELIPGSYPLVPISTVADAYIKWYEENVRTVTDDRMTIQSYIENSALRAHILKTPEGIFARGIRIRMSAVEEIDASVERHFGLIKPGEEKPESMKPLITRKFHGDDTLINYGEGIVNPINEDDFDNYRKEIETGRFMERPDTAVPGFDDALPKKTRSAKK